DVDGKLDLLVECNRVVRRIEAFIVGAHGVENLPADAEARVVIEGLGRGDARRYGDGQDDVAVILILRLTPDAADGLDDVDHGIAWVEEDDAIEGGDVHALGETASVGKDASLVLRDGGLEPRNLVAALEGVHGAIDVLDGDLEIDVEQAHVVGGGVVLELLLVLADERGE